jgi:hypothetical protein
VVALVAVGPLVSDAPVVAAAVVAWVDDSVVPALVPPDVVPTPGPGPPAPPMPVPPSRCPLVSSITPAVHA